MPAPAICCKWDRLSSFPCWYVLALCGGSLVYVCVCVFYKSNRPILDSAFVLAVVCFSQLRVIRSLLFPTLDVIQTGSLNQVPPLRNHVFASGQYHARTVPPENRIYGKKTLRHLHSISDALLCQQNINHPFSVFSRVLVGVQSCTLFNWIILFQGLFQKTGLGWARSSIRVSYVGGRNPTTRAALLLLSPGQ